MSLLMLMEVGRDSQEQGLHYSVHSQTRPHLLPVLILPFHFRKLSRQEMLNRRFNILIRVQISNSAVSPSLDDYGDHFVICPILELSFTALKYSEKIFRIIANNFIWRFIISMNIKKTKLFWAVQKLNARPELWNGSKRARRTKRSKLPGLQTQIWIQWLKTYGSLSTNLHLNPCQ